MKYHKHEVNKDGYTEWIPTAKLHRIACCDCGLVHDFQFKKVGKVIYFKARRNNQSTANKRKKKQEKE